MSEASVFENSPAARAGLKKGDVIISVDGVSVSDVTHFRYLLYKHNIGDKIIIEYNRNGVNNQAEVWLTK